MATLTNSKTEALYLITYRDPRDGRVIDLKAHTITDSSLGLSFVVIRDFVFDTESLVANPTEEGLRKRFENTKSLHLSIYSILSIEEIGKEHKGLQFEKSRSNLLVLPTNDAPKN
jgi:hypothetical protein